MNTKEKIQKYIERNNITGGLKYLLSILKGEDDQLYDEVLIVQNNYKRAVRNFNNRILDMSDLQKEEARTASALLDYADDIMDMNLTPGTGSTTTTTTVSNEGAGNYIIQGANTNGGDIIIGATPSETKKPEEKKNEKRRILFFGSNPQSTGKLQLEEEFRRVSEKLQHGVDENKFALFQKWAVQPNELIEAILEYKPNIIHFSGHGTRGKAFKPEDSGLLMSSSDGGTRLVNTSTLSQMFELFRDDPEIQIDTVILNACYSENQAKAICKFVPYVIGMNNAINDNDALDFSTGFYLSLSHGKTIDLAYRTGKLQIQLEDGDQKIVAMHQQKNC